MKEMTAKWDDVRIKGFKTKDTRSKIQLGKEICNFLHKQKLVPLINKQFIKKQGTKDQNNLIEKWAKDRNSPLNL